MKKLFAPALILLLCSYTQPAEPITEKERKLAVSYLQETRNFLKDMVAGLSENQLNWKPNDSTWSAAECVEHIALSEKNIYDWGMSLLQEKADPSRRSEVKLDDEGVKKMITDRSNRVKTREGFFPTGQFGNTAQTLQVFSERRDATIKFISTTDLDLRNHYAPFSFTTLDGYQLFLFISGHSKRHTLQIQELKEMPGFPKK